MAVVEVNEILVEHTVGEHVGLKVTASHRVNNICLLYTSDAADE